MQPQGEIQPADLPVLQQVGVQAAQDAQAQQPAAVALGEAGSPGGSAPATVPGEPSAGRSTGASVPAQQDSAALGNRPAASQAHPGSTAESLEGLVEAFQGTVNSLGRAYLTQVEKCITSDVNTVALVATLLAGVAATMLGLEANFAHDTDMGLFRDSPVGFQRAAEAFRWCWQGTLLFSLATLASVLILALGPAHAEINILQSINAAWELGASASRGLEQAMTCEQVEAQTHIDHVRKCAKDFKGYPWASRDVTVAQVHEGTLEDVLRSFQQRLKSTEDAATRTIVSLAAPHRVTPLFLGAFLPGVMLFLHAFLGCAIAIAFGGLACYMLVGLQSHPSQITALAMLCAVVIYIALAALSEIVRIWRILHGRVSAEPAPRLASMCVGAVRMLVLQLQARLE